MRFFSNSIQRVLDDINFYSLNRFYAQEIWNFYKILQISLCVTGLDDINVKKRNILIAKFISKYYKGFDKVLYGKIKDLMQDDSNIIDLAINQLTELNVDDDFFGDYYISGMLGVSIYD